MHWIPRNRDASLNVDGIVFVGSFQLLSEAVSVASTRYEVAVPCWEPADVDWLSHRKTSRQAPSVERHQLSTQRE